MPSYSDVEIEAYRELCRHAEKALNLNMRRQATETDSALLQQAIGKLGIGIIALDSLKRVILSNTAAERLLENNVKIVGDRLDISGSRQGGEIEQALDLILLAESGRNMQRPAPLRIHHGSGKRPIILYLLPMGRPLSPAQMFLTHARVLMMLIDSDVSTLDPTTVRDVLGITLGEAKVAALVGSGRSPRHSAEQLGIAEETARTVLKRVFAKVGVSTQNELAALLGRIPSGLKID
jgi:DNA-binding CsgD family transcriptional regulator